ncbi:MAG: Lrp/AsnC family transcriptional regulator, partial [Clostridia bacterium]|nr:Lrp/AsnC family transcriptional regulator [Clostridia bacterium]
MRNKILSLLEQNAGLKHHQIAVMLDMSVEQVDKEIEEMTEEGILLRSKALINWEKTDREFVAAQIELKVTPQRG